MKDLGQTCIECKESVAWGSGRYVNRVPAGNEQFEGYLCADCQSIPCDRCGETTLEYYLLDEVVCPDCATPLELLKSDYIDEAEYRELIKEDTPCP